MFLGKYIYLCLILYLFTLSIILPVAVNCTRTDTMNYDPHITCKENLKFAMCLPLDYDNRVEPWKYRHLANLTLPWNYHYGYSIHDVQEVNDKKQTVSLDMYLKLNWIDPRIQVNITSIQWKQDAINIDGEDHVPIPIGELQNFWIPDPETHAMKSSRTQKLLNPMASLRVNPNKRLRYLQRMTIILSCQMSFNNYPFDSHECLFRQSSFYHNEDTVCCTEKIFFNKKAQRNLQYKIEITNLTSEYKAFDFGQNTWRTCGFKITLRRHIIQIFFQVYVTSTLLVMASWVSFIVNPSIVPGRMGLLVTILLVLINIFIGAKTNSPPSSGFLNAVDIFLVFCILEVFAAFVEYATVLHGLTHQKDVIKAHPTTPNQVSSARPLGIQFTMGTRMQEDSNPNVSSDNHRQGLDRISLMLFPITFLIFALSYVYTYGRDGYWAYYIF